MAINLFVNIWNQFKGNKYMLKTMELIKTMAKNISWKHWNQFKGIKSMLKTLE